MKDLMKNALPPVAPAAAAGTNWLTWIPDEITKLACLVTIMASLVCMYKQWMDSQKSKLEIEIMKEDREEKRTKESPG